MNDKKDYRVSILGTGTWGTALAKMLSEDGRSCMLWSVSADEINELETTHAHKNLPGCYLPENIKYTTDMKEAVEFAKTVYDGDEISDGLLVFAVPSVFVRSTAEKAAQYIKPGQVIVDVAKGIEPNTHMTMTQIIDDVLQENKIEGAELVALSGPTHAEEVAVGLPSTIVAASKSHKAAAFAQEIFSTPFMRVYTNKDVLGVEICAALKNVIALASGIATGLGYGDNLRAAIITRGLAEITRLGIAMNCNPQTFSGLAGIGDLIVTATSHHSRNNNCGILIGQGKTADEATREVGMVVEGINALPAAMELSGQYGVELPIAEAVDRVVKGKATPKDAFRALMDRAKKSELY